jgi:hypothetical protein
MAKKHVDETGHKMDVLGKKSRRNLERKGMAWGGEVDREG